MTRRHLSQAASRAIERTHEQRLAGKSRRKEPFPKEVLEMLLALERRRAHPHITHQIRQRYLLSKKTKFYLKEYGPHSHVAHVIFRESIRILLLASLISSIGGLGLQSIEGKILAIIPLLILIPALNDMVGDMGTIVSSKYTTLLFLGKASSRWWKDPPVRRLYQTLLGIGFLMIGYASVLAILLGWIQGYASTLSLFLRLLGTGILITTVLISVIFLVSIVAGLRIFNKGEDPNNFLIPITTAVADLGSLLILTVAVHLLF